MLRICLVLMAAACLCARPACAQNLHLIDQDNQGFALYRSGVPVEADFDEWCRLGITEVLVLSGSAATHEERWAERCPALKVIGNIPQDVRRPLTAKFLEFFDAWVQHGRKQGRKLLFRCECGCHRAGRLAAYYEIKYMGHTMAQVAKHLYAYGASMDEHLFLRQQIEALYDYANNQPCPFRAPHNISEFCVSD